MNCISFEKKINTKFKEMRKFNIIYIFVIVFNPKYKYIYIHFIEICTIQNNQ